MFWNIFNDLCNNHNIKPNALAKLLDISSGSITSWKKGTLPNSNALIKISNYFNVSIDYLLGISETKQINTPIQDAYNKASDEIKLAVKKLLDVE